MYYVYILKSGKDNKRYVGFTENLEQRISEHKSGLVKSTRHRKPLELVYFEPYEDKTAAMNREKYFKSGYGREYLKSKGY